MSQPNTGISRRIQLVNASLLFALGFALLIATYVSGGPGEKVNASNLSETARDPAAIESILAPSAKPTLLPFVSESTTRSSTLRIGLLLPASPDEALSLRRGASLGVAHANRIPGLSVRLIERSQTGQWGTEGNEAAWLALDAEVDGIITPASGVAAHQVLQVAGRTRIPVASLCPDSSITGAGVPWAAQIVPRTDQEASAIFAHLTNQTTGSPAYDWTAVAPDGRAGREVIRDLQTAARTQGRNLRATLSLRPDAYETKPVVDGILRARTQGILLWVDPLAAGRLALAVRQAGFDGVLAGPSWLRTGEFISGAGFAADGVVVAVPSRRLEDEYQSDQFASAFRSQFKVEPDVTCSMAHDAVLLLTFLNRTGDARNETHLFPLPESLAGASGLLQFDSFGTRRIALELQVCRSGLFVQLSKSQ